MNADEQKRWSTCVHWNGAPADADPQSRAVMTLKLAPQKQRSLPPPRRWRNWWRDIVEPGDPDPYPDRDTWPSREIAETKALEELSDDYRRHGRLISEYLGAEPD